MGFTNIFKRKSSKDIAKDRLKIQITKTSTKGLGKTPALYANIPILDLNK